MPNGTGSFKLPWFCVFFWVLLLPCLDITLAQDLAGIARSARAQAEREVRRRNAVSRVRSMTTRPSVTFIPPTTPFGVASGTGRRRTVLSPSAQLSKVHGAREVSPAYFNAARVFQLTSNEFLRRAGKEPGLSPAGIASFRGALADLCPAPPPPCSSFEPYRRADGTCNNLWSPLQGSQSTPQPRYLTAAYEDFFQAPRLHGVGGLPLPSARTVSNRVHQGDGPEILQTDITLFMMQWGQFTDHDIVLTPIALEENGEEIKCCEAGLPKPMQPEECLYIPIYHPDPYFPPTTTCMEFVRSVPAINSGCIPGQRQQLNIITSYIDASNVYGSTQERQDRLRGPKIGGMLDHIGPNLPEDDDPETPCNLIDKGSPPDYCLLAGDVRVMEQSALSMIHTAFMREHNRIATALSFLVEDEIIFQETRKIVAAEMQHITYNEYLPLLLGDVYMNFYGLYSTPSGFNYVYSPWIDASIVNVFAAATYRYGHSQVPNELMKAVAVEGPLFDPRAFDDLFFRPNMILKPFGADALARYTATANSQAVDRRIEQSVRNKLFKNVLNPLDSLDLAALNIQRGRDHGLPPYNAYRVLCGRNPYLTWADVTDHDLPVVAKLQLAYSDPQDIDMFTGALSERYLPGSYLGPTNACILGNQFRSLKLGDRFFYENPFSTTGFTLAQLNSIKTTSLARIICKNMNTPMIQPNIFRKVGPGNPLGNCDDLPDIDLSLWHGPHPFPGHMYHGKAFTPPASPIAPLQSKKIPQFLVPKFPPVKY